LFPDFKNVKITFFQQETSFSGGKYDRKISKKLHDVPLSNIYLWCEFKNFSLKPWRSKRKYRNSKNLKLWSQKTRHPGVIRKIYESRIVLYVSNYHTDVVALLRKGTFSL